MHVQTSTAAMALYARLFSLDTVYYP